MLRSRMNTTVALVLDFNQCFEYRRFAEWFFGYFPQRALSSTNRMTSHFACETPKKFSNIPWNSRVNKQVSQTVSP